MFPQDDIVLPELTRYYSSLILIMSVSRPKGSAPAMCFGILVRQVLLWLLLQSGLDTLKLDVELTISGIGIVLLDSPLLHSEKCRYQSNLERQIIWPSRSVWQSCKCSLLLCKEQEIIGWIFKVFPSSQVFTYEDIPRVSRIMHWIVLISAIWEDQYAVRIIQQFPQLNFHIPRTTLLLIFVLYRLCRCQDLYNLRETTHI